MYIINFVLILQLTTIGMEVDICGYYSINGAVYIFFNDHTADNKRAGI